MRLARFLGEKIQKCKQVSSSAVFPIQFVQVLELSACSL